MDYRWWLVILLAMVFTALYVRLWRKNRRNIRKMSTLFDAVDNLDFSIHFPEERDGDDKLVNSSLNRIKNILQKARLDAREKENYYEKIMESVDTGIMVVDKNGYVLQHNKRILQLLDMMALTHISQVGKKLHEERLSVRESAATLTGERVRIIAVDDIGGELSDKEVDSWIKLIRVLTHEIMNSITPIISLSETLMRKSEGDTREAVKVINQTSRELIDFVQNYRKFTRIPIPQPQLLYVKPFLERMASLSDKPVTVSVIPSDLIVYADEGLVARVMTNLIKNAGQALGDIGSMICIKAYTDSLDNVVIDVSDDGEMIPPETASQIFVPFFTTRKEGNGIGLSISRQIMHMSGGTISLITDNRQRLTTFRLIFK